MAKPRNSPHHRIIDNAGDIAPPNSPISSDSDSSFLQSIGRDIQQTACDELPIYDIKAILPHESTPSPINHDEDSNSDYSDNDQRNMLLNMESSAFENNEEFASLQEINSQICPLTDNEYSINRSQSLETIFEGEVLIISQRAYKAGSHANSARLLQQQNFNNNDNVNTAGNLDEIDNEDLRS